jgi:hypothetical protein
MRRKPELACVSIQAPIEVSAARELATPSWLWRAYLLHARRPTAQRATGDSRKRLDIDVGRVQRGEQRFNCAMRRFLVGRRNGLRDSLDISFYLPSGLRRGADQVRHAGLVTDRRTPPAIRLGVLQDRAVVLWPVGGCIHCRNAECVR